MKKILMTLAVLLCFAAAVMAEVVSPAAAREAAARFLQAQGATLTDKAQTPQRGGRVAAHDDAPAYYVFNADAAQGFVVVSGDDCVGDNLVLGYADQGSYSETDAPDGLQWWLEATADAIARLSSRDRRPARVALHDNVAPMLTTTWDQDFPYNYFCPEVGGSTLTGCMATALAQVMRYHRWPQDVIAYDLPGYTMENGFEVPSVPAVAFDWDNMQDGYAWPFDEAQVAAVATLMRYAGQSLQMNYSPAFSGGICFDRDILVNCFGYDPGLYWAHANDYSVSAWDELIYGELHEGRPVLYGGQSSGSGHAFVLDGYKVESGEGYFHVNWGWSGNSNGFFKISLLDPQGSGSGGSTTSDGYNYNQEAYIGLEPRRDPTERYYRHLSGYQWNLKTNSTPRFDMINDSWREGKFSISLVGRNSDGTPDLSHSYFTQNVDLSGYNMTALTSGSSESGLFVGTLSNNLCHQVFDGLAPGSYDVMFVSRERIVGAPWSPVYGPSCYYEVFVGDDGSYQSYVVHPYKELSISASDIRLDGLQQCNFRQTLTATVRNEGESCVGGITCLVYALEDGVLTSLFSQSKSGYMLEAGASDDVEFTFSVPQAGDYVAVLLSVNNVSVLGVPLSDLAAHPDVLAYKQISVGELDFECTAVEYQQEEDLQGNPAYLLNMFFANGTPLDYNAFLVFQIFVSDGELWNPVFNGYAPLKVAAGATGGTSVGLYEPLQPGDYYAELKIACDFRSNLVRDYFLLSNTPFTVTSMGIGEREELRVKSEESDDAWYDLTGRKYDSKPTKPGIYVHKGKKVVIE